MKKPSSGRGLSNLVCVNGCLRRSGYGDYQLKMCPISWKMGCTVS